MHFEGDIRDHTISDVSPDTMARLSVETKNPHSVLKEDTMNTVKHYAIPALASLSVLTLGIFAAFTIPIVLHIAVAVVLAFIVWRAAEAVSEKLAEWEKERDEERRNAATAAGTPIPPTKSNRLNWVGLVVGSVVGFVLLVATIFLGNLAVKFDLIEGADSIAGWKVVVVVLALALWAASVLVGATMKRK